MCLDVRLVIARKSIAASEVVANVTLRNVAAAETCNGYPVEVNRKSADLSSTTTRWKVTIIAVAPLLV